MRKYLPFGMWSCFQNIFVKELSPPRGDAIWINKNTSFGKLRVDINGGRILKINTNEIPLTKINFPLFGTIELTNFCNLRCVHCLAARNSTEAFTHKKIISLIDELADGGVVSVGFSGGEPTLIKDLPEIIEYASRRKKMQTLLFTNGTLLDNILVKKLKKAGLSWVGVSVDSYKADKHDNFRGVQGTFMHAIQGIKNSVNQGFNVWIRCILSSISDIDDVNGIFKLAQKLKVNRLYLIRAVNWGNAKLNHLVLPNKTQQQFVNHIIDHPEIFSTKLITVKSGGFDFLKYRHVIRQYQNYCDWGCGAGTIRFRITNEGYVLPCPFFPLNLSIQKRTIFAENVLNKSFAEIWKNSQYLKNFRYGIQKIKGKCRNCYFIDRWCRGGCRAESLIQCRSINSPDPLCHYDK